MVTNGWRRRRAIKGKCPNFPKGHFPPLRPRLLPLKLWLLHLTKRTNLELWLFLTIPISSFGRTGGTFYAKSGSQGRWRRNSGSFRNVTNIFPPVDLGQNWLNTACFLQFHRRKRNIPCSINRAPPSHTYNQQKSKNLKEKCGLLFPRW